MTKYLYTITTIRDLHNTRCVGIFTSLKDAVEVVETNACDIAEREYLYAVIEQIVPGLYCYSENEYWYEWNGDWDSGKFIKCEKPKMWKNVKGFGIG